jgi:hypothetical protein
MSKAVDEILNSIVEEFKACRQEGRIRSKGVVSAFELLPAIRGKRAAAGKPGRPQVSC